MQGGLIETEDIIIDAKSGVSGAGRSAKQNLLYTEIAEGINCYGVGSHRHMPEIEQAPPYAIAAPCCPGTHAGCCRAHAAHQAPGGVCFAQGLSEAAGAQVRVSFTPTLMPMSRGMQATCYVRLAGGASPDDLRAHLQVPSR